MPQLNRPQMSAPSTADSTSQLGAKKQGAVTCAMMQLELSLSNLHPRIDRLEDKLSQVLSKPTPEKQTPGQPSIGPSCGLEEWMNLKASELASGIERLEDIIRRVEL